MDRGFLILAQNTKDIDYVKCAIGLAKSIKNVMPNESITLVTTNSVPVEYKKYFNHIVDLPVGDLKPDSDWKLSNDWQVYDASPYEYTIKLEADMYIPRDISYWWDILKQRDLVISTTIRNYHQEVSTDRYYRRFIDQNKLPDCYNAITYFKKSDTAKYFFTLVKNIFDNWEEYRTTLQCQINELATTDWVYSIASHIIGVELTTLPMFKEMSMIHMKRSINNLQSEDWTEELVYELLPNGIRINTIPQMYPFHYHIKSFSDIII